MLVLGIDPGLTGALALYDPASGDLTIRDMPTFVLPKGKGKRTELDLYGLAGFFDHDVSPHKVRAYVEMESATPQMGVSSAFSFGGSYWAVRMACAAYFIPHELVPANVWKRDLRVPKSKDGARARASSLLPRFSDRWSRVKDDGRAEASLIALWGSQQIQRAAA